jgi:hypothetical protein
MTQLGPDQALTEWRTVERRLSARDPDATDFEDILREAERLRAEYRAANLDEVSPVERRPEILIDTASGL